MTSPLATRHPPLAPLRVTFLTVMPSPYVQDLFAALAADARIQLTVWYLEQVAPDTYWGEQALPPYAHVLLGQWFGVSGARVHWNPGIRKLIEDSDADLFVIVGYIGLTNQLAMRALNRLGRPWVFWGEIPGLHQRRWLGRQIRAFLQRPLRRASGIAGVGSHAVQAYRALVAARNPGCVFRNIPYHCRLDAFIEAGRIRQPADAVRILYCGQLIARKGVDLLCRVFNSLVRGGHPVTLTLVGEGPLRAQLEQELPPEAREHVHFAGFQPVDRLPAFFGDADVFVLPSRHDGWGVVVNQALAAGLPTVVTRAVGAANDLVTDGENGCVIDADSEQSLLAALELLIADRQRLSAMGRRSLQIAERITLSQGVEDWYQFLGDAVRSKRPGDWSG